MSGRKNGVYEPEYADEVIATKRIWTARPLLVAYVIAVGFTVGLLVNRAPEGEQAVAAMGGGQANRQDHAERERTEPPLWLQLFRPSQPTARLILRLGLPALSVADGSVQEQQNRNLLVYWTGRAEDQPQTLFQTMLPFLRPDQPPVVYEPPPPVTQPPPVQPPKPPATEPGPSNPPAPPKQEPPPAKQEPTVVNGGLPVVGIYHTHDWESYISEFPAFVPRNADDLKKIQDQNHQKRTIMGVGNTLAVKLKEKGVASIYAEARHQSLGYDYAYKLSRDTARQILKEYPSVKILLDLHRDGAWGLDTKAEVNGKSAAKIRCIIGNNEQPNWEQNQAFCDEIIARLEKKHPGLTLPTRVQPDRYNQDLMVGAVLLEIGGAMNSYEEAEQSAVFLAEVLAEMIREGAYPK